MDDAKTGVESLSAMSVSSEYYESDVNVEGPTFNSRDYMISPSDSDALASKESAVTARKKILPIDLKLQQHDALDGRKALKKLQNLLGNKFGRNFVERHATLVRAVVRGMPSGFLMEDIASVTEVTEFFIANSKSVPEYVHLINMILKIAANPPRIMKSSETIYRKKELSSYFTMLGELLAAIHDFDVQSRALEVLNSLLCRPAPGDATRIKPPFCFAAMEESLLPHILACLLETVPDEFYNNYLKISIRIAVASKKACVIMTQNGAIEFVLRRLGPRSRSRGENTDPTRIVRDGKNTGEREGNEYYTILDTVVQIMWIFLDNMTHAAICESPSQSALQSLRYAFHAEATKKTEKAIATRNNLACILIKLYTVFGETLPLMQSGFAVDVAMLAVATEIGTKDTWAENIYFGTSKDDYFFKEIMMLGCCELAKDENMLEILREQNVLEGILKLINPEVTPLSVSWSSSQFLLLLISGLAVLAELVPVLPDVFVGNDGNGRLLLTLEWFMEEHFDKEPLLETLKTLCALISCKNNRGIIEDLKRRGGAKTLLNLCFYLLESETLKKENQEKLTRVFFILEKLCENERKIQTWCGNVYVIASIRFLTRATKNQEEDSKLESRLLICFSAFLWEAIVWCPALLKCFAEQNGINLLLDLIEMSPYPVQIILLGLLVDVADEGENTTHIITWRDRSGYGILNSMINIWKKEELLHRVPRTDNGCIADVERALMSEEQWYLTHCIKKRCTCSPAIAEMMCNARPKIHSLYRIIRERHGDLTRLKESLYSVSFGVVQPQNEVYIPLIEHFFTLKLGEIWYETYHDVIVGGLVPTLVDGETLRRLIERKHEWAYRLKVLQEEIVAIQKLNGADGEKKLYKLIRSCCMTSALDALHELDFVARTTYKDVEVKKKALQVKEIEGSLNIPLGIDDGHIHRTALRDSNVTYVCGKYVWFKSEREVVPENSLVHPVSPNSSSSATTSQDIIYVDWWDATRQGCEGNFKNFKNYEGGNGVLYSYMLQE